MFLALVGLAAGAYFGFWFSVVGGILGYLFASGLASHSTDGSVNSMHESGESSDGDKFSDIPVLGLNDLVALGESAHLSVLEEVSDFSGGAVINPTNGLMMVDGMASVDVEGHPYGFDDSLAAEDTFSVDDSSLYNDTLGCSSGCGMGGDFF